MFSQSRGPPPEIQDVDIKFARKRDRSAENAQFAEIMSQPWQLILFIWRSVQALVLNEYQKFGSVLHETPETFDLGFIAQCSKLVSFEDLHQIEATVNGLDLHICLIQKPLRCPDFVQVERLLARLGPNDCLIRAVALDFGTIYAYCAHKRYQLTCDKELFLPGTQIAFSVLGQSKNPQISNVVKTIIK
jgi:hypothetical protein